MRIWVADGVRGLMARQEGGWRTLGPPGTALCLFRGGVFCAGERQVFFYAGASGRMADGFAAEGGVCAMACRGEVLYTLSADAGCLTAREIGGGGPLFSAPVGKDPRLLSVRGGTLAVADGAEGRILFFDRQLQRQGCIRLPGPACGVCLLAGGAAALCGAEEGARFLSIGRHSGTEEIFRCPNRPCCLARRGRGFAVGSRGAVFFVAPDGGVLGVRKCVWPGAVRPNAGKTLICDSGGGQVLLEDGRRLYAGPAPEDALILPG